MLPASLLKYKPFITFSTVTLLFVVSQWVLFNGYNGADDLHYAMLSAKMLKGQYNPFEPNDIYSGRILLISIQAFIYKIFGISVLTTSAGTIVATIIACYLTVFLFLHQRGSSSVFILCSFFYFSPVLTRSIKGIMPDAYVMLAGILILLILKRSLKTGISPGYKKTLQLFAGFMIAISLLLKETALVFLPFSIIFYLLESRKNWILNSLAVVLSFTIMISLLGIMYYYATGNFFFKIYQIKNSEYENACNFSNQPYSLLLKRMTVGAWERFIISGFYPLILGFIASISVFIEKKKTDLVSINNIWYFLAILILGLYFPFSLKGYQPLCDDPRQFLFLIPFCTIAFSSFINTELFSKDKKIFFSVSLFILLLVCVLTTLNKWQWMIYSFMLIASFIFFFVQFSAKKMFFSLSIILFFSAFERLFFLQNTWFQQMKTVNNIVKANHYYFINQDDMMHWKLLHNFNEENIQYHSLQNNVFKIFQLYHDTLDKTKFQPGWLILNKKLNSTPKELIRNINSSEYCQYYSKKIGEKDIYALLLSKPEQLKLIQALMK